MALPRLGRAFLQIIQTVYRNSCFKNCSDGTQLTQTSLFVSITGVRKQSFSLNISVVLPYFSSPYLAVILQIISLVSAFQVWTEPEFVPQITILAKSWNFTYSKHNGKAEQFLKTPENNQKGKAQKSQKYVRIYPLSHLWGAYKGMLLWALKFSTFHGIL